MSSFLSYETTLLVARLRDPKPEESGPPEENGAMELELGDASHLNRVTRTVGSESHCKNGRDPDLDTCIGF